VARPYLKNCDYLFCRALASSRNLNRLVSVWGVRVIPIKMVHKSHFYLGVSVTRKIERNWLSIWTA
jgi:hypothetical protein